MKKDSYLIISLIGLIVAGGAGILFPFDTPSAIIVLIFGIASLTFFIIYLYKPDDIPDYPLIEVNTPELEELQKVINQIAEDETISFEEKDKIIGNDVFLICIKYPEMIPLYTQSLKNYLTEREILRSQPPIQVYEGIFFFDTFFSYLDVEVLKNGVYWYGEPIKIEYDDIILIVPERYKPNKPEGYLEVFTKTNKTLKIAVKNVEKDFEIINFLTNQINEITKEKIRNDKNQMGF